jgi:hypothetical protein
MSLIKKIDVKKHFAARRAMRLAAARSMGQPDATGIPETRTAGTKNHAQNSVEISSHEHSASRVSAVPIE